MKIYNWTDRTGKVHKVPEGSCVLCKNHSDIFLDPFKGNEIYSCVCSINKEEEFDNRESIYDTFCSGYIFDEDDERTSFSHEFIKA